MRSRAVQPQHRRCLWANPHSKSQINTMYKTIALPSGTSLFRSPEVSKGTDEPVWFAPDRESARMYSSDGRASEFKASRDLVLLDLWTPETWAWIQRQGIETGSYSGTGYTYITESDPTNDFVKLAYDPMPSVFPGGTIEPRTQSQATLHVDAHSPRAYHVLSWRGLIWGPHRGEYKRSSDLGLDYAFIELLRDHLPKEIDGIFSPPVPGPRHKIDHLGLRKVFHGEIVVFPPAAEKVALVTQGGRSRRRRRRSRFHKQVRLTRRNALHTKR
jgi:hypothetical protein